MSVYSKMTALADEIRELSGTTEALSIDAMTTNVSEANDEVNTQVDLIAQLSAALEGKAGGSSETNMYSQWIQVCSLPEAPQTYAVIEKPDLQTFTYYYEAPENCLIFCLVSRSAFNSNSHHYRCYHVSNTGAFNHVYDGYPMDYVTVTCINDEGKLVFEITIDGLYTAKDDIYCLPIIMNPISE